MPTIYGTDSDDSLTGSNFTNITETIFGYDGNDAIDGGNGDDFLDGGNGDDDIFGGDGRDTILGRDGNDTLKGGADVDYLYGEAGNDWLWGGSGVDYLVGGFGDDIYLLIEDSRDYITEYAEQGTDTVRAYASYTLTANVENLELVNSRSALEGTGNVMDNIIKGNRFANLLRGWDGNDFLLGQGSSDNLYGGLGSDTLYGDAVPGTSKGFERFNDQLYGENGDDWLYGGQEADILVGGGGEDYLEGFGDYGNHEIDALKGGADADTFVLGFKISFASKVYYLDSGTEGRNKYAIIQDFNREEGDRIRLGSNVSQYSLIKNRNFTGSDNLDTAIFRSNDLIAVVQDTTTIRISDLYVG